MSEDQNRTDWSKVNDSLKKRDRSNLPINADRPLDVPKHLTPAEDEVEKPDGMVANFKANQVKKKAALNAVEVWYSKSLDVFKHRLSEVAKVRKEEATVMAKQALMDLDAHHLDYLLRLGLQNERARREALVRLGDETAASLKEIDTKDWPAELIEQTIAGVFLRHQAFFSKITAEIGQSES